MITVVQQVKVAQKWKLSDGIVEKIWLLVPLFDGGDVSFCSVHDGVFFHQTQPTAVGGRFEAGVAGQGLPRDGEAEVEAPDKSSKAWVDPLDAVLEADLLAAITQLECVGSEASSLWLALLLHLGFGYKMLESKHLASSSWQW